MDTESNEASRGEVDRRLHVGWGLILTGGLWLLPAGSVPPGAWLAGVAGIVVGVNVVRYLRRLAVSGFAIVLGLSALMTAVSRVWRTDLEMLAVCLLFIGASLVARPLFTRPHQPGSAGVHDGPENPRSEMTPLRRSPPLGPVHNRPRGDPSHATCTSTWREGCAMMRANSSTRSPSENSSAFKR